MSPDHHTDSTDSPFWWAVEQARTRDLSQAEFVVLAVLANGQYRPWVSDQSIAEIALCGRLSVRRVQSAIRKLEAEGLVITDRRKRQPSLYHINHNPEAPPFRWPWEIEEGVTS